LFDESVAMLSGTILDNGLILPTFVLVKKRPADGLDVGIGTARPFLPLELAVVVGKGGMNRPAEY
jgi:hypothetical protein